MLLNDLLKTVSLPPLNTHIDIAGLAIDSRKVSKDFLFIALQGFKANGISFLQDAFDKGAVAALVPENTELPKTGLVYIPVPDTNKILPTLVHAFYPKHPQTIVTVTGTNGKTSTANFVRQIWETLGKKSASVGTLGVIANDFEVYGNLTTPDILTLHQNMDMLCEKGITHVAMEASSHGIDQHRIDGVNFAVAGFTNITRDHLDYHPSMDHYFQTKLRLFDRPLSSGTVVLNADIKEFDHIRRFCQAKGLTVLDYGKNATSLKLVESALDLNGQMLTLNVLGHFYKVRLPLAGTFQAMNALCALGLLIASGEDAQACIQAMALLTGAAGRLEYIGERQNGATVYVDYAHTPDALETILKALRPHTQKRLHLVFGCGGDRDAGKRPLMGEIAQNMADVVYVTDDNPRTENALSLRAQILPACPKAFDIGNRALAIQTAVSNLKTGDLLVIAGKGHEKGQLINGVMHPFDDRLEAMNALQKAGVPLWSAQEIKEVTGASIQNDFDIFGISIDTRTLEAGDLFIALKGENMDGHDYVATALSKGASGAVVSTLPNGVDPSKLIVVKETMTALEQMGSYARDRGHAKIIGITGSNGKTSTKEMLRYALMAVGKTHYNLGNLNNQIGVPLTLSRMHATTDFALIEMGMNHTGELSALSKIARPDVALITMVGSAHQEFFKTQDDIALAKSEIFDGMQKSSDVFLNADNKHYLLLKDQAEEKQIAGIHSFGSKSENDIALINAQEKEIGSIVTAKIKGKETVSYTLPLPGKHQVLNSLGVLGVLSTLQVDLPTALQGLSQLPIPKGRGQRFDILCQDGSFTLIDDAYNANPDSMRSGLRILGDLTPKNQGRRIAILGDMLELGKFSLGLHKSLTVDLIENNIDLLFAVGPNMEALFNGIPIDMQGVKTPNSDDMTDIISSKIKSNDIVLVKGSLGSRMAKIVDRLKSLNT